MNFSRFLMRISPVIFVGATLCGVVGGLANAKLIALISDSIGALGGGTVGSIKVFILAIVVVLIFSIAGQMMIIHLSNRLTFLMRISICDQIMKIPFRNFEEQGHARLLATFTQDIASITGTLTQIPSLLTNVAVTLACLLYLGYLSPSTLVWLTGILVFATITYLIPDHYAVRSMIRSRDATDRMYYQFNAMTAGMKELRLNYPRQDHFFRHDLVHVVDEAMKASYRHRSIYAFLTSWTSMLYFVFLGVLIYLIPELIDIDTKTLVAFSITSLYIIGPVSAIVSSIPVLKNAQISYQKVQEVGMFLDPDQKIEELLKPDEERLKAARTVAPLRSIQLKGVVHEYYREREERHFVLGPMNMTINKGELLFIVGGNGSGKTTLTKLITGLYRPLDGCILWNGTPVTEETLHQYRQNFTAIFSDFHVFDHVMGLTDEQVNERAKGYLQKLQLDHKVTVSDGRLSTTALSTGQRKRLALVVAYLEDRQIYIFDEWAADQDPEFKEVFYRKLLPELKEMGKTILVISHDDRYFSIADRIIKLADGKIISGGDSE